MNWDPTGPIKFAQTLQRSDGSFASVVGGSATLYGTCYCIQIHRFLNVEAPVSDLTHEFILSCQDPSEGWFVGPELRCWTPVRGSPHDLEHLKLHLTCAVLPVLQEFGFRPRYPLFQARAFADVGFLRNWLDKRDLGQPWLEGNNLFFVAQLLIYLRDEERDSSAAAALDVWFAWLEQNIDPRTGLWGTDRGADLYSAVYGGYHQLLAYYYVGREIPYRKELTDSVLRLQHQDGGFNRFGGGGACEDVDAVDILVNLYKMSDYRRTDIRAALRRCTRHLFSLQNPDGGFPYRRDSSYCHMGIPATESRVGESGAFATWFRVHTLALIAEILTDETSLARDFRFSRGLSMGWHHPWAKLCCRNGFSAAIAESFSHIRFHSRLLRWGVRRRVRRMFGVVRAT